MLKEQKNHWAQLIKIIQKSRLIKLKVFYQILFMTIIMIVFLGTQTYTGLRVINTMQNVVQTIFSDSVDNLTEISRLKNETANIQILYLQALAGKDPAGVGLSRNFVNLQNIIARVKALQNVAVKSKIVLESKLNALLNISNENPSGTLRLNLFSIRPVLRPAGTGNC